VAAAAGFVLVAGVLVVARMNPAPGGGAQMVASDAPADVTKAAPVMQYDPAVQEYVRAHRSVGNSLAVAVPGGGLRRVDITLNPTPER
jgi:hypothetical protein